ncbi:MAG: hypothetical protein WAT09_02855 [Paracoccaceae bacterium]
MGLLIGDVHYVDMLVNEVKEPVRVQGRMETGINRAIRDLSRNIDPTVRDTTDRWQTNPGPKRWTV